MYKRIYIAAIVAGALIAGCDDRLEEKAQLDVNVTSESMQMADNAFVVKKSEAVVFNFSGNPDFITFFSGENGREYSKRNLTESPVDQITSRLEFYTKNQYGTVATVENTLRAYLSTEFTGMMKNNKVADSTAIDKTAWINISEAAEIPNAPNKTSPVANIPLDAYLGKRLTIAFEYFTTNNTSSQPVWEIYELKVVNTNKEDGTESSIAASTMGFTPLDMYATPDKAYNTVSNNTSGIWNLSNIAAAASPRIRMHSSGTGAALNRDWLVSNPFIINARTPDRGVGIKTISNRLDSYTYKYNKAGTYVVTFIGTNSNFESTSDVIKEVVIKVID